MHLALALILYPLGALQQMAPVLYATLDCDRNLSCLSSTSHDAQFHFGSKNVGLSD